MIVTGSRVSCGAECLGEENDESRARVERAADLERGPRGLGLLDIIVGVSRAGNRKASASVFGPQIQTLLRTVKSAWISA